MKKMGVRTNQCLPKNLIRLKRQTGTTLIMPAWQSRPSDSGCAIAFCDDDQDVALA